MRRLLGALALTVAATAAGADALPVGPCPPLTPADLAEPWETQSLPLPGGARLALLTGDARLIVLAPPQNGARGCTLITLPHGAGVDFEERGTAYDGAGALLVDLPLRLPDGSVRQLSLTLPPGAPPMARLVE